MVWSPILIKISLLIYAISGGFYIKREFFSDPKSKNHWTANLLYVGIAIHTFGLLAMILETGYLPIKNLYETLVLLSWTIIAIYILVEYLYKIKILGAFILPFNSLLLLYTNFLPNKVDNLPVGMRGIWLSIHTSVIFISYGVFTLAFCVSLLYLIQEHQLKEKKTSVFYYRLPPLGKLDSLSYRLVMLGFPLLTIGILTGALWSGQILGTYWEWNSKQIWITLVWLIYAVYLHNRYSDIWRGKKSAYITVLGFLTILFTYLGLNFITKNSHYFT